MRTLTLIGAFLFIVLCANTANAACARGQFFCSANGGCCLKGEKCEAGGCIGTRHGVPCGSGRCPVGYYCHHHRHAPPTCGR